MRTGNKRLKIPLIVSLTIDYLKNHSLCYRGSISWLFTGFCSPLPWNLPNFGLRETNPIGWLLAPLCIRRLTVACS